MEETTEQVAVHAGVIAQIRAHSIKEHEKGGYEAVGFMARSEGKDQITTVVPLANHSSDPQRGFFVEPWEQYQAEQTLARGGYEIVGVYHSHPTSEAIPSGADKKMARPGEVMAIYSVAFDELRLWREKEGSLNEVSLSG